MVLERYEQAVEIQCPLPYLLHLVESHHPIRASHDPEYFTQVSTSDEVQRRMSFHIHCNMH
jgi:hypothetical protein